MVAAGVCGTTRRGGVVSVLLVPGGHGDGMIVGGLMIKHFRRKRRFWRVILPEPSIRTLYCRLRRTSTMCPVLSHLWFQLDLRFWRTTCAPTSRDDSSRVVEL